MADLFVLSQMENIPQFSILHSTFYINSSWRIICPSALLLRGERRDGREEDEHRCVNGEFIMENGELRTIPHSTFSIFNFQFCDGNRARDGRNRRA